MGTSLATYYAKLLDMPDSEYKVEILEDGPIKKIAVNGKIYEVDYNMGGDSIHSIICLLYTSPLAWSADFPFFQ